MRRLSLVAVALAVLIAPVVLAQGGPPANQATQQAPPKSTAIILGQVVDGSSGQPVPDAMVTLTQMGGRGANPALGALQAGASPQAQQAMQAALAAATAAAGRGGPGGPVRVMTGSDGRFVFHDLAPGQFQVTASLTGYTASLNAGAAASGIAAIIASAATPQGSPTTIALKEGEFATGVRMRLWKHAVVSGRVLDDAGEPAIGLTVQVARRVMAAGRARYVPGTSARTDDRGVYRLSGLVPGNYLVVVPQTQVSMPSSILTNMMESMTGGGAPGGGLALLDLMTSGISAGDALGGGVRIGDYMVASSGAVPILGPDGRLQAFQTVFFPGAAAPTQATVISLASGEERTSVDFQLQLIPTARVSGKAVGPEGPVANLGIHLVVPGDGTVSESEFDVATAVSKADGTFSFYGVPPGQFFLRAFKQPRPEIPAEALAANPALQAMFAGGAKGITDTLFASETINVSSGDVDGMVLQLTPGFHVSGRIEIESLTGRPQPTAAQLQNIIVVLTALDGKSPGGLLGSLSNPDRASAQGEFRTKGYQSGEYVLTVTSPSGWVVKSATVGGRDVLDAPLAIKGADVTGIVVTLTDRLPQLSGSVKAPGETDLSETSVLMFPAGYRGWIERGMSLRLARSVRASRSGAYTITNVPAGEYLVAAIDRASEQELQDPAFIEALSRIATRVTVGAEPATLDVTKTQVVVK